MSLTEGYVSGWLPSCGDYDNVDITKFAYPITVPDEFLPPSPTLSRTASIDSHSHHVSETASSFDQPPSPGSSVDHTDGSQTDLYSIPSLSSSDRRAIRNRLRDPEWVPRPRNAFIIFRCEFSRKHARDPSDSSDTSSRSDKTLSKRAGEEWRRLSAAEREQYKVLAEQEKAAHALQNPDYRFKPVRRPPPGMAPSLASGRLSASRRTDRSAQVASLIMRSERGASSLPRDDDYEVKVETCQDPVTVQVSSSTAGVIRRRRSASMPQPVVAQKVVAVAPSKARTPVPISCVSSPGPTPLDFEMFSSSEMDDSPLYTPVLPTPPPLHGLSSAFQMQALPEHPSPMNGAFECGMDVGDTRDFSAPLGPSSGPYVYTDSNSNSYQHFTFADGDLYPTSLELTTPYSDWSCAASTESCLAHASATAALPMSQDTGVVRSFGPTPLPIPLGLQHTTSALDETPAAHWDTGYAEAVNEAAMFGGGAPPDLAAAFAGAFPAGYDVATAQVGLNEFLNAL
ncbi:hypothetical protein F5148DRAFT_837073 [Russula earlei]|uniref:Uncharacterized protein n=1 Tax=Russula earlei TaxID=71964 RepID=A0ACC0UCH7_9AGAM|nr:hypothetical protein F5148DRAFT_837073 [Russula earlei]